MNSYADVLKMAASQAAAERRPVYVSRDYDGFGIDTQLPPGACVQVWPNGDMREIGDIQPRPTHGPGNWTGD